MKSFSLFICSFTLLIATPKPTQGQTRQPFQQRINYDIEVSVNHQTHTIEGTEFISYFNHSPDTLYQLFIHLYWNAFKPGSMMDTRSQVQGKKSPFGKPDWDARVQDRIANLKPSEQGSILLRKVTVNGQPQPVYMNETIAQIPLSQPIAPNTIASVTVDFNAQVPKQIRRSGRNNAEGVMYSMSQWYPKICAYDKDGWHPNPYIGREFYGEWGDFDVAIQIDTSFHLAGSGYLVNNKKTRTLQSAEDKKIWSFNAPQVHDFVWAADTAFVEKKTTINDNIDIHIVYKKTTLANDSAWNNLIKLAKKIYPFMKRKFGPYTYKKYSFIQGGDGGMEYPMATLIKMPNQNTAIHEWMHSWYQMVLATNESLYAWMDEGFTTWGSNQIKYFLDSSSNPLNYYQSYVAVATAGVEEPLCTHADHFHTNVAYSVASYVKGAIFLDQLGYIVGEDIRDSILLSYYHQWKYKHPTPNDFIKIAEDISGIQLDWYKEYWIHSTRTIDYRIDTVQFVKEEGKIFSTIKLERLGKMPMPVDLIVTFANGTKKGYTIPLDLMYGHKKEEEKGQIPYINLAPWQWTHPNYVLKLNGKAVQVDIDPSGQLADINKSNNSYKSL